MIYELANDLFAEILRRGFDPRAKDGRDNILYLKLKKELKCPEDIGLQRFLTSSKLSAADFIIAFFKVVEPFSLMYRDIYSVMKQHSVKSGSESIKIRFDSLDATFDIDLSDFQEWMHVQNIMRRTLETRLWSQKDFWKLSEYFSMLGAKRNWNCQRRFEPSERYDVPKPVPSGFTRLDDALEVIYNLLSNTASEIYEANRPSEERFATVLREVSLAKNENNDDEYDRRSLLTNASFTRETFPSVLYSYEDLLERIHDGSWNRTRLEESLSYFKEILSKLRSEGREEDVIVETFFKILDLPFWKYRWYVYEVWTTMILVRTLSEYGIELQLEGGTILPLRRGKGSVVGQFQDQNGRTYFIISQRQTSVSGILGRKAICPDIRVAEHPGTLPEQTIVIVECKQRRTMRVHDLQKNISLYEQGAPSSIQNIFVNYDQFPMVSVKSVKTSLLSEFQPKNPHKVQDFSEIVLKEMMKANILPKRPRFDALLIDISGSMQNAYDDTSIQDNLLTFLHQNRGLRIFYFNDNLIEPGKIPPETLAQSIRSRITGGTSLSCTLESLKRNYPNLKKIAILTDGDYGQVSLTLRAEFEIVECLPVEMSSTQELWG